MSTTVFRRSPRRTGPELPTAEIGLQEPPTLPEASGGNVIAMLTYLPMAAASGVTMLLFVQPGGSRIVAYLAAGLMAVAGVGMFIAQLGQRMGERKQKLKGERRDYLRYLTQMRREVRKIIDAQRRATAWNHPDPDSLWSVAMSSRLWERRASHGDFAEVRIARGEQRLAARVQPPETKPVEDLEPLCASALRRFIRAYTTVPDVPIALYLRAFSHIRFDGDADAVRGAARALVAQLVTFHAPEDLRVAVCAAGDGRDEWEWAKWLPHALHPSERDAAGPVRLVADTFAELQRLLDAEFTERPRFEASASPNAQEPYVVIVVDGGQVPAGEQVSAAGYRNAVVLDVSATVPLPGKGPTGEQPPVLRLRMTPERVETISIDRVGNEKASRVGLPDSLSVVRCRRLARLMSAHRLGGGATESVEPMAADIQLTSLLGITDPTTLDPKVTWKPRSPWDQLRVPIGVAQNGSPIELDIKEAARGGMGPHGMLIGATGSGKSELLRTLLMALATTHSSQTLNFILVDFKGGATFLGLDRLPHTSAVITNLSDELPLVDRMQDAIHGELNRRQELLRRAGNYSSIHDYEKARASGVALDPLPYLFIVVDEFSELLAAKRDFMDLFIMIGRLGRSLGVHLLLASQRLDEGRVHQLETHLSYRIGLRMFSSMESRSVIGSPAAYELPSAPGNGFLRTDTSTLIRFKAAYVSGAHRSVRRRSARQAVIEQQVVPYGADYLEPRVLQPAVAAEPEGTSEADEDADSLMKVVIDRLVDQGPPAHRVWLPPLDEPPTLDELLGAPVVDPERGLQAGAWTEFGTLRCPVGVVDKPFEQLRDVLLADVSGGAGHVGIVGAPQSGKSTLVRSLICSLALTHTPAEVQFYCLDFGGGTLASLEGLPHVGGVAGRLDTEKVSRTAAEVQAVLADREQRFRSLGVDSMATYRRMRAAGELPEQAGAGGADRFGDVFLVVDGWFTLNQDFDHLESVIHDLAARGLGYGIHIVVTAARWMEIRPWLRDLIGTRFELRLGDSVDSEIDTKLAGNVPAIAGRGLTADKLHSMTALPRTDGRTSADDVAAATRDLVASARQAWQQPPAPAVRLLPRELPVDDLPAPDGDLRVALGWDETRLEPVWHDFEANAHLIVFGDTESGKTNLLRLVARAISQRYGPREARVMLADTRRDLFDAVPQEMQLGYAVSGTALRKNLAEVAASMAKRMPGPDITPARLKQRDWWTGPQLFLLIDDYDLLATSHDSPMEPILEYLAQGTDIGLHVVVARSTSSATRGMMDAGMRRLWETSSPALLMSCPRDESHFFGDVKPKTLPPGRAQLITRRKQPYLVQTGLVPTFQP